MRDLLRYRMQQADDSLREADILRNADAQRGLKVNAAVKNARAFLDVQAEFGSFSTYIWRFVGGLPTQNAWRSLSEIPAETDEARQMSKDLKRRGFTFVGPTICYAFMQAVGMV